MQQVSSTWSACAVAAQLGARSGSQHLTEAGAQPMIDSYELCAQFLSMRWGGVLWGKGGPPKAVESE